MAEQSIKTTQKSSLADKQTGKTKQKFEQKALHRETIRLVRMGLIELEKDIEKNLDINPALEEDDGLNEAEAVQDDPEFGNGEYDNPEDTKSDDEDCFSPEKCEHDSEGFDKDVVNDYATLDDVPYFKYDQDSPREKVQADTVSFNELLQEQVSGCDLTEKETLIMNYLIGSLDDYGYLRKHVVSLVYEMESRDVVEATEEEVSKVIKVLQSFEPAGIGAKDFNENLILQIRRVEKKTEITTLAEKILTKSFTDFYNKHYKQLCKRYKIDQDMLDKVYHFVRHLNPYPASSVGDDAYDFGNQITPDFVLEENGNGFDISLNRGYMPKIKISSSYAAVANNASIKKQVSEGKLYMEAIRQRQYTMMATMRTIVQLQMDYFRSGNEDDLKPMTQKDVAKRIKRDSSTVSGVVSNKYADTPFGIIRLGDLFRQEVKTGNGKSVMTKQLKQKLKEIVDNEDKENPIIDEDLAIMLGIKRRTVAKYRKSLGIPIASRRK